MCQLFKTNFVTTVLYFPRFLSHTGLKSYLFAYLFMYFSICFKKMCVQFWVVCKAGGSSPLRVLCNSSWWLSPDDRSLLTCWVWCLSIGCWRGIALNAGNSLLLLCEQDKLCLETKNPLRWPLAVWLGEQWRGRQSVDWQLVGADVWLKVHLEWSCESWDLVH